MLIDVYAHIKDCDRGFDVEDCRQLVDICQKHGLALSDSSANFRSSRSQVQLTFDYQPYRDVWGRIQLSSIMCTLTDVYEALARYAMIDDCNIDKIHLDYRLDSGDVVSFDNN